MPSFKWLMVVSVIAGLVSSARAQEVDIGKSAFQAMCAMCHGTDGKGKGLFSEQLKVTPTDLTVLAKKNGGVLPVSAVFEVIDGRKVIAAHGTREMPIWGANSPKFLYQTDKFIDPSYDPEAVARTRILTIIDYLNRIQEK